MSTLTPARQWNRVVAAGRKVGRRTNRGVRRRTTSALHSTSAAPLPSPVRRALSPLAWRRGTRWVPVSHILMGGQNGMPVAALAEATGDLLWGSRRVADGPHAALLRAADAGPLTDADILASPFADLARASVATGGQYFSAIDDDGIVELARDWLRRCNAGTAYDDGSGADQGATTRPHQSQPGGQVLLAPIQGSDHFQVVDGHHRVAAAQHDGSIAIRARIRRVPVTTPLQDVLGSMSWLGGERELYQPIDAPELRTSWTTVRRCTDRLEAMGPLLDEVAADTAGTARPTYLDVASFYGWFVHVVGERGYDAQGVELDPVAPTVGAAVYGLPTDQILTGDAVDVLGEARQDGRTWDVVSCFSLLHHFALGRASIGPEELVRLLDSVTARVLFLDTGQAHEEWFRDSLPEWDTDYVRAFLEEHGTFDRVIDLGPDADAVAPYERNYGRHLFACIRDR